MEGAGKDAQVDSPFQASSPQRRRRVDLAVGGAPTTAPPSPSLRPLQ
jgi:hypothetical protein